MNKPKLDPQGYYLSLEEGHFAPDGQYFFDIVLAEELSLLLSGKSICDFGCGLGKYVNWLRVQGFECDGFDGNPNTPTLTGGVCRSLNLAKPVQLVKKYDSAICLEVGEHIPKEFESIFLDNLTRHAKDTIVLSWAIPGQEGDGHVNCRPNSYIIYQLWRRGFQFRPWETTSLRTNCFIPWFKNTLMVFSKKRRLYSLTELKIWLQIVGADIERLKKNNRSNSSFTDALIGKIVRTLLSVKTKSETFSNRFRLFSYDLFRGIRPPTLNAQTNLTDETPKFFPVCFTCRRHFRYVRLALFSLRQCSTFVKTIYIYVDRSDPLTDAQRELLQSELPFTLIFQATKYPMSWGGLRLVLNELKVYRELAKEMKENDFLVKFDSDVLFLSDGVFRDLIIKNPEAAGTSVSTLHPSGEKSDYMQGGCYFIRGNALKEIVAIKIANAVTELSRFEALPEDKFINALLCQCGKVPSIMPFVYFDRAFVTPGIQDDQLNARLQAIPAGVSVVHFEGDKWNRGVRSNMKRVADRLLGQAPPVANPYR
jgi:Methyltransferase domain